METEISKTNLDAEEDLYPDWRPLTQEERDRIFGRQTEIDFFSSSC